MSARATNPIPAVVVAYEPDAGWPEHLRTVTAQCPRTVVVDNSTSPTARSFVRETLQKFPTVTLLTNPDNPGLGRALNQGCALLAAEGFSWFVAFDQDSTPRDGFVPALLTMATGSKHTYAAVGANWRDIHRPQHPARHLVSAPPLGCTFRRRPAEVDLPDVLCVITSGTLFSLVAWQQLGGFDEVLQVDLVDTEFCLRARLAGWLVGVATAARLDHQRGNKRPVVFLGRTWHPAFIPPPRLHLQFRNRLLLGRRHGWAIRAWLIYDWLYAAKLLFDLLFLEDNSAEKFRACLRGLREGFTLPFRRQGIGPTTSSVPDTR